MDEEFRAGAYDSLDLPPVELLDPRSDPFGMGYEWLGPEDRFAGLYAQVAGQFPSDLSRESAGEFRRWNPAGAFASGTDRELLEAWVEESFVPLCRATGGDLVERIRAATAPSCELTREVTVLLRKLTGFEELEPSRQVAVAFTVIDAAREHLRPR